MWRRRELWPIVFVSLVGNSLDHRPEREPIKFGDRTSGQRPMGTDEHVEKELNQGKHSSAGSEGPVRFWMLVPAVSCLVSVLSTVSTLTLDVRRFLWRLFTVTLACVT